MEKLGDSATGKHIEGLKQRTFFWREKENLIFPIAPANLAHHGVDEPHLWHGKHELLQGTLRFLDMKKAPRPKDFDRN